MALTRLERAQAWILSACMGVLFALFRLLSPRRSRGLIKLLPVTNPLLMMSAMQLAQRIRRREVRRLPGTGLYVLIYFTRETTFPECFHLYGSGAVGLKGAANGKRPEWAIFLFIRHVWTPGRVAAAFATDNGDSNKIPKS